MSVIRRPAYLTYMFESQSIKYKDQELSRQTCFKAESTKQFFLDHYKKLKQDSHSRNERFNALQRRLNTDEFTIDEKNSLAARFYLEEAKSLRRLRARFKAEQYERIKLIGRGGYGEVWLAYNNVYGELCALKVLKKAQIIQDDQVVNVRSEREVLSISANQWIVDLKCSFQDDQYLYLVMEYVPGGDLMSLLVRYNSFLPNVAKFYCAEILIAVNSVHQLGFVHRDIKPDNILISRSGHIKLTDFGLATKYTPQESTLSQFLDQLQEMILEKAKISPFNLNHKRPKIKHEALSIDYSAPEVLLGDKPTQKSDYWSVGVILYEMIYGFPPFSGQTQRETALRILHWPESLRFHQSRNSSREAIDLMSRLLCYEKDRLSYEDIIRHPFFYGFPFNNPIMEKPPHVPVLLSPFDTSHFEDILPNKEETCGFVPVNDLTQFAFLGFTYKSRPANTVLADLGVNVTS